MPSVSPEQQRLFGQAYAVKTGDLDPKDIDPKYRDRIVDLADSMSKKDLEDFAKTKYSEMKKESKLIPEYKDFLEENSAVATVSSVNGMGSPSMPGNPGTQSDFETQVKGSGDKPLQLSKGKSKKKKKSSFQTFKDFIKGADELRPTV
jgi:hypothetical protein